MSTLDPSGPSQPTLNQAYTTPGNAVSKDPSEASQTTAQASDSSQPIDKRVPSTQASSAGHDGTPSALGYGVHGAPAGEEAKGLTEEQVGRHKELDAQQMAAPGEGRVADAVAGRTGGVNLGSGGSQPDFAADLDRKKAEQQEARDAMLGKKRRILKLEVRSVKLAARQTPWIRTTIPTLAFNLSPGIGSPKEICGDSWYYD